MHRTVFCMFVTHCLFCFLLKVFMHRWHYYAVPACNPHQRCFSGSSSSSWTRNCLSSGSRGRCRRFGLEEVAVVVVGCGDVEQRGEGGTGEVLGSFLRLNCACCSGCNWKRSDLVADFPGNYIIGTLLTVEM